MTETDPLHLAFLEDHRIVTGALHALQQAVDAGDLDEARRLADELDRVAGPHMEFEERFLYPTLVAHFGAEFVERLYDEHACGQRALQLLRDTGSDAEIDRDELRRSLDVAMSHVLSCGTLSSHMTSLDSRARDRLRRGMEETRQNGVRWTALRRGGHD